MAGNVRRTVVITGASAGIGRATATAFARRGWNIALLARGREGLESAREEVEAAGGRALVIPTDVAQAEAVNAAADQIVDAWGGFDVWVNSAMVTVFSPFQEMTADEFRRVTDVTYLGQVHGTMAALRHMCRQGHGTIVCVGSALAYRGIPLQSAYCGAKFAIRGFLDALRSELIHDKSPVRLTMVQLPGINTPQFDWARNKLARRPQPLPPVFQPEAAAEAIVRAAREAPRELWVGRPSLQTIIGNMLAPGLLDRLLASKGYSGQQSQDPSETGRADNLLEALDHERSFGAQGRFDSQAASEAVAVNPTRLRQGAALAVAGVVLGGLAYVALNGGISKQRRWPSPPRRGTLAAAAAALVPLSLIQLRRWRSEQAQSQLDRPSASDRRRLVMEVAISPPISYPPIERHGVIGDRRTAALVAADGTLDWLCLPDFDGDPVFGSLLDADRGGLWRLGPASSVFGRQRYVPDTASLVTTWETSDGILELTDAMLWPETDRSPERLPRRSILRRLRCRRGRLPCAFELYPRDNFDRDSVLERADGGLRLKAGSHMLGLWTSVPVEIRPGGAVAAFEIGQDEEIWAVLGLDEKPADWSVRAARASLEETEAHWQSWLDRLSYFGPRREQVRRSALTFHLMTFAPSGALVAAPTVGLPERIGGPFNVDYRYTWIRDISLSLASLSILGDVETGERYMDWVAGLDSASEMPLQVVYRITGATDISQHKRKDIAGYRESKPVTFGNHAFEQKQIDSLGYLADCAHIYLQQGGRWKPEYWTVIRRLADYTAERWREPGNGIWELEAQRHFVSGKVMSWVTLDRATKIAEKTGDTGDVDHWRRTMDNIQAEVMEQGWSERLRAFRQHYEDDTLDASTLLIPIMGFLPPDHPRVRSTVERIEQELMLDGLVYRFDPRELPNPSHTSLGEREAAFLPCTFWMAAVYALMHEADRAEAIMERAERVAGDLGLFAEGLDPRADTYRGNTPLLFSHAEYLRAVIELAKARPVGRLGLMAGQAVHHARRWFPGS
jgi:GH15 family glucan-1,4-alpha-glucosidase/NAD(P)-dependent dehydrogenase (short-subunit alcohol dehydrogenase family)